MRTTPINPLLTPAIHVAIWLMLFLTPYIIGIFYPTNTPPFNWGVLVMPTQLVLLFYVNYLFLINRFLFNRRITLFLLINVAIIVLFMVSAFELRRLIGPPPPLAVPPPPMLHLPEDAPPHRGVMPMLILNAVGLMLVAGVSVAIKMTGHWYVAQKQVAELEQANTEAELQQLKSQLNPHFLFNSLNNIYALIAFNPDKAQASLHSLCDMLRYQLYEANREMIPLQKEIEFVNSYCNLMQLRLTKLVSVTVELPKDTFHISIAPLLFVTLVENAFKHGVAQAQPSYISIRIFIDRRDIVCIVRNSNFQKCDTDRSGSGIGLENLQRRLALLYPHTHYFRAEQIGSEYITQLIIYKQ